MDLIIEGIAPGRAAVTVTTDSNGQLATTTFAVTVTAASRPGDIDMDGRVTIDDLSTLIDVLLGSVLANYDPRAADVDGDGRISISDLSQLIDLLLQSDL